MRMRFCFALIATLAPALATAEPVSLQSTGAPGTLSDIPSNCAPIYLHADATYESGVSWRTGGVHAPYYGAFAEQYQGTKSICAFVADLTQDGPFENGQTADFYLWDNQVGESGDIPGNVLYVLYDFSPWPIAFWPNVSRILVPLPAPVNVSGSWWAGIWGNWPGEPNAWYLAADTNGSSTHVPMTDIIASGFPPNWQPVASVWSTVVAVGIGVEAVPLTPSGVPDAPIVVGSFGRVKSLYR